MLLVEPSRRNFFNAVNDVNRMVTLNRSRYKRIELMFYYSGHSDEEGILLNREKILYNEIKSAIQDIPADVHIVILDSCSSGAFTRSKGGVMHSPFLMDSSYDMKGYAYMTSSSDHESSQESDRIGGSFFTHYLVSGLRGAADMSRDGRVTLNEAYQYAYGETLTQTEKTLSGPQHPHYNIRMTGTGDVVMTDIRKSSSGMVLEAGLYGRIAIRDSSNRLVAEMDKTGGRELVMGLESGTYTVINERDGTLYETTVNLPAGRQGRVTFSSMKSTRREFTGAGAAVKKLMETMSGYFSASSFSRIWAGIHVPRMSSHCIFLAQSIRGFAALPAGPVSVLSGRTLRGRSFRPLEILQAVTLPGPSCPMFLITPAVP
jgi:hypothetical protein